MRIIHVIESGGGSTDFVLYMVKYLPQHHHHLICSERTFENNPFIQYPNISIYPWNGIQREISVAKDIRAATNLYRLIRKIDADVVHLHSSKAGFIGRLVCFFLRKKNVIYTPHAAAFLRKDVSRLKEKLFITLERVANKLSGRVIACSRSEASAFIQNGIPSDYINNGTEIVSLNREPRVPDNRIVIVTVGRVTAQKGPEMFNSIAKMFEGNDRFKFLWIGNGEQLHLLTSGNITVTGWMTKPDVLREVAKADIYLSTALWEGLPLAVLEAMHVARPLVLSRCTGNVDLVEEENNGFTFLQAEDAARRIDWLALNPEARQKMGAKSRELAIRDFSVEAMVKKYELEYEKSMTS